MRQEDIQVLLRRDPCPLLRLHLTGGQTYDVPDRDLAVLTRSTIEDLIPGEKNREAVISLIHVVWVEVVSPG